MQRVLTEWLPILLLGVYATVTMAVLGSGGSVTMAVGRFVVGGSLSLVSAVNRCLARPHRLDPEAAADGV